MGVVGQKDALNVAKAAGKVHELLFGQMLLPQAEHRTRVEGGLKGGKRRGR